MIKIILKSILKVSVLLIISISVALYLSNVFRPDRYDIDNDTKSKLLEFYNLKNNSLDILLLGSSHMYYGINPGVLYEETGLNSYIRGGECQPIEVSYYLLKEAYQSQKPRLVVLDVFGLSDSVNTCKTKGIYRVNIENMKTSSVKIEAYYDIFSNESILYNIFDISFYKERWHDIKLNDFNLRNQYELGSFGYTYGSNFSDVVNNITIDTKVKHEIGKKELEYLNKIKELCIENNSELLLIKTPYYLSDKDNGIYESIKEYSDINNINFINYNDIKEEINYVFDIDGDTWHSNVRGSLKLTNHLSKYINDNYEISKNYIDYSSKYHNQVIKLKQIVYSHEFNLNKLMDYVKEKDQTLLLSYNYFPGSLLSYNDKVILNKIGFDFENNFNKKMIIKVDYGKRVEEYYSDEYFSKEFIINNQKYLVESNGYVNLNNQGVNVANNYACVTIIDESTGTLIDTFCLDTEGSLYIHRDR